MGRKKPGKPRRPRGQAHYTLQQLQPPGELYEEWFRSDPEDQASVLPPEVSEDAQDLMRRLIELGPHYDYCLPTAAIHLDWAVELGKIPVTTGDDSGYLLSTADLVEQLGASHGSAEDVRASMHNLHARGVLLMELHEDTPMVRLVKRRPQRPGDRWIMEGDREAASVPGVCIPQRAYEELTGEQFGALLYLRTQQSELQEPDPAQFADEADLPGGTQEASALFATVRETGWSDYKGCEACPAGHLCSRPAK